MKDVAQEQYTQSEAERGAGMTKEKYPPAHPVRGVAATATAVVEAREGGGVVAVAAAVVGGGGGVAPVEGGIRPSMDVGSVEEDDDPDL